ncbi:hypothetical protein HNQ53_003422 [Microbulbifer hydrolyticus]|uniref:Uncharacterized protein n=1 Tax=Microbulbifer hydrolyticus TaxID=48074 RepID=A0AA89T797_9GAMM|nr:hypothetical protein [Microbulbifer hydrolyticus]
MNYFRGAQLAAPVPVLLDRSLDNFLQAFVAGSAGGNSRCHSGLSLWKETRDNAGHDSGADHQNQQKSKYNPHAEQRDIQTLLHQ